MYCPTLMEHQSKSVGMDQMVPLCEIEIIIILAICLFPMTMSGKTVNEARNTSLPIQHMNSAGHQWWESA